MERCLKHERIKEEEDEQVPKGEEGGCDMEIETGEMWEQCQCYLESYDE